MTTAVTLTPRPTPLTFEPTGSWRRGERGTVGAGLFCFWLFAGGVALCVASGACLLATLARLVIWYRSVYRPLCVRLGRRKRGGGGGGGQGVGMVTYSPRREEVGGAGGGGGVMALYRSVLFISREGGEIEGETEGRRERERDGGREGEGREGESLIMLETAGAAVQNRKEGEERGGREGGREGGGEEQGVFRKTLYRLFSRQEEIEGWRDVMEECRVTAEDGGRRGGEREGGLVRGERGGGGGGGVSRKRYSLILREEREEVEGGREELDWVVGGWEVAGAGGGCRREEELRSSWGEWLSDYLPSMPWGVTTPPEASAAE